MIIVDKSINLEIYVYVVIYVVCNKMKTFGYVWRIYLPVPHFWIIDACVVEVSMTFEENRIFPFNLLFSILLVDGAVVCFLDFNNVGYLKELKADLRWDDDTCKLVKNGFILVLLLLIFCIVICIPGNWCSWLWLAHIWFWYKITFPEKLILLLQYTHWTSNREIKMYR